jgi:hypothetical protein
MIKPTSNSAQRHWGIRTMRGEGAGSRRRVFSCSERGRQRRGAPPREHMSLGCSQASAYNHSTAACANQKGCRAYPDFCHESPSRSIRACRRVALVAWSGPDACRPLLTARRAASSRPKSGRTSAPFRPQAWQVNSGLMSDSRTSSGHLSPLIAVPWLHL